ncbi:THUMP domain-containing protein 2 [Crotalus adamanteus]|uniref:THUMP domain-containing protein 2 n=1 Tax=Crotalus adamanteus TaxID=8729 RepID=A0AAW1CFB5_CROAD
MAQRQKHKATQEAASPPAGGKLLIEVPSATREESGGSVDVAGGGGRADIGCSRDKAPMADGGKRERPKEGRRCSRYFCTAGRGMEPFLIEEVQARLGATQNM